jgi:hypothetical protein
MMMAQQEEGEGLEGGSFAWQDIWLSSLEAEYGQGFADAVEIGLIARWGSW